MPERPAWERVLRARHATHMPAAERVRAYLSAVEEQRKDRRFRVGEAVGSASLGAGLSVPLGMFLANKSDQKTRADLLRTLLTPSAEDVTALQGQGVRLTANVPAQGDAAGALLRLRRRADIDSLVQSQMLQPDIMDTLKRRAEMKQKIRSLGIPGHARGILDSATLQSIGKQMGPKQEGLVRKALVGEISQRASVADDIANALVTAPQDTLRSSFRNTRGAFGTIPGWAALDVKTPTVRRALQRAAARNLVSRLLPAMALGGLAVHSTQRKYRDLKKTPEQVQRKLERGDLLRMGWQDTELMGRILGSLPSRVAPGVEGLSEALSALRG